VRVGGRTSRLVVQVGLLVALVSAGTFVMLRPYLSDDERIYNEGRIDNVISQGPVTIQHVEWKLDSLKVTTALIDKNGEAISMDAPAGSAIVVATMTVTPRIGVYLKDRGFTCDANLRDDRGNTWETEQPFDYPLPTYCGDNDHPFTMDKPAQVAKVYLVPKSAVEHLTGVVVEDYIAHERVLITP
jgi:hypothetical protein